MSEGPSRKTDPAEIGHIELLQAPALEMHDEAVLADVTHYYWCTLGRRTVHKQEPFLFQAVAMAIRDRMMERRNNTRVAVQRDNHRRVCYLSLEFLMGRLLRNALLNLDLEDEAAGALARLGMELEEAEEREHDAGLGNGGLGRLAACFLDSCATLGLPVTGYGIRYNYGMFRQSIEDGFQREEPDNWLREGFPWEIKRIELAQTIHFGGHSTAYTDSAGAVRHTWTGTSDVLAIPFDVPIPGYRNEVANTLRLWSAAATDEFDLDEFNAGGYMEAVAAKNDAEKITMVLYPNTATESGHELRLRQQYFLASASLQDTLRTWRRRHGSELDDFADKHCFQLNDTHPAVAVPELMRLLMDEYGLAWDYAWDITRKTMAYTNHTLLPEALEQWPVDIFARLLPRLLDIIVEINERTLAEVAARWPGDNSRLERMSLISGGDAPMVRMAHLAIVGSYSVNGVAALHSELLRSGLFRDFAELWPDKFNNKTNGVTQRRWLAACNPQLAALITEYIGDAWVTDLPQLEQLRPYAEEPGFQQQWRAVKLRNKARLSREIEARTGIAVDTGMLFDVQVKRIHEYKRQLLNLLHAIHLYDRILRGDGDDILSRAIIIGGKAAPGYVMAKNVIKCICTFGDMINKDPRTADRLRLIFFPDYNVSAMELICPAAELSEQISTAGKEASGTGNMKFMMNGALTIGTLDGANVEIREAVGDDNFFLFGLTVEEIQSLRPTYDPQAIVAADKDLERVINMMTADTFDDASNAVLRGVAQSVLNPHDQWMTAADFRGFVDAQQRVEAMYRDTSRWTSKSILNTASSGRFSTDRTISDYNADIWHLDPVDLKPK